MKEKVLAFLRKILALVAPRLKPLARVLLREALVAEVGQIKDRVRLAASQDGPGAVDRAVDEIQDGLKRAIEALPLPAAWEAVLEDLVQKHGDALQTRLREAVRQGGPQAVDRVADVALGALLTELDRRLL